MQKLFSHFLLTIIEQCHSLFLITFCNCYACVANVILYQKKRTV